MPLNILEEDDKLICVDKPAGISVWSEDPGENTVATILSKAIPALHAMGTDLRFGAVHRLDKDTSGVLLFAKTPETYRFLQEQFQKRGVEKRYICLLSGNLKREEGEIRGGLGRSPNDRRKQKVFLSGEAKSEEKRDSLTLFRVRERFPGYTLVEALPKTGRKHQLRAHFSSLGNPLAGDKLYGFKNQPCPPGLHRQFLHASFLSFLDEDGNRRICESPLPEDLKAVMQSLKTQKP